MQMAMVTSWLPRPCGIATYSLQLVEALRRRGHRVYVICHTDGGRPGEEDVFPVLDLSKPDAFERLYETVEQLNPQLVHIQHEFGLYTQPKPDGSFDYSGTYAFGLAVPLFRWKATGRPTLVTFHSDYGGGDSRVRLIYLDCLLRLIRMGIMHHRRFVAQVRQSLRRPIANIRVVPHGAPAESRPGNKAKWGIEGKPVVGLIGWFDRYKGYDRAIRLWPEVVAKVPNAVLFVAAAVRPGTPGGADLAREVEELIAESPVRNNILHVGRIFDPDEFLEAVATFDILMLPYTSAAASGPLSQAAAAGVPVVVTPVGGLKAYVDDSGAGLVGESDDELVEALVRLLTDERLRREMSLKARRYARRISWPQVAKRHEFIYRRVLGKP